jgi:hypothetical protein
MPSKAAPATKQPKVEAKEEVKEEVEAVEEKMENTTSSHGIFSGRIKTNPDLGKFLLDVLNVLEKEFDGIPTDDMLTLLWGESKESLDKVIKKSNKRKVIEKAKFVPKGLTKPATSALVVYARKLKEECEKNGTKYTNELKNEKWSKISAKEKEACQKIFEKERDAYKAEIERQRNDAIKKGEFPEDKPKRGQTAYFHFLAEVRPKLTEKFKVTEADVKNMTPEELKEKKASSNTNITKEAAEMWKALSDKQKAKYVAMQEKDREEYAVKEAEWKKRDLERRKKNGQASADESVDIETSNTKKVDAKPAPAVKDEKDIVTMEEIDETVKKPESDDEAEEVKPPVKAAPAKKPAAKKEDSSDEQKSAKKPAAASTTKKPSAK